MQREVARSDSRSIFPAAADDRLASRETFRVNFGKASDADADAEVDLYETLLGKGLLEKSLKQRVSEDDSLTASCTESYSSWNGSFQDSFPGYDVAPQVEQLPYQLSPQPHAISGFPSALTSPRRRRRRHGSFDRSTMGHQIPPSHQEGPATHPESPRLSLPFARDMSSAADASLTTSPGTKNPFPRLRLPRRKHGSFLESSSTSCCLEDIVEEGTENTLSSDTTAEVHQQDVDDIFGTIWEAQGTKNHSQRRVSLGHAEVRFYQVTLDQCGGYGLEGKPVPCPLTLDWSFARDSVVRKPAILFGYSSYWHWSRRPQPISVGDRRARLGILHRMRQSQVKRWEYRSLLHQMASLQPKGGVRDRWHESDEEELDSCGAGDRVPQVPLRGSDVLYEADTHDLEDAIMIWKRNREMIPAGGMEMPMPSARGVDMPVIPMRWIDHDSQALPTATVDSWGPLAPLSFDSRSQRGGPSAGARDMLDSPSLWLSDSAIGVPSDQLSEPDEYSESLDSDFRVVPFQPLVSTTMKKTTLFPTVAEDVQSRDWKRSPPIRAHCRKLVPFDRSHEMVASGEDGSSRAQTPALPFQCITERPGIVESSNPAKLTEYCSEGEKAVCWGPSKFRPIPFVNVVAAACARKPSVSSPRETSPSSSHRPDEILWRRNILSPSTSGVSSSAARESARTHDGTSKSHSWLDEVSKIRDDSRRMQVSESSVKALLLTEVKCPHQEPSPPATRAHTGELRCVGAAAPDLQTDGAMHASDVEKKGTEEWIQANPMLCLYQDVPASQKGTGSQRTLPNIPFVWLPVSIPRMTITGNDSP